MASEGDKSASLHMTIGFLQPTGCEEREEMVVFNLEQSRAELLVV